MPKKLQQEIVSGTYFVWRVGHRSNGIFYADGRSNKLNAGRHSLATADRAEALAAVRQLDAAMAVKFGLADASILQQPEKMLLLADGIEEYLKSVKLPVMLGGAAPTTFKRYRTVFDKLRRFAISKHIHCWQEVSKRFLEDYGRWLHESAYAPATVYLELTTIKQAISWLIEQGHLPETSRVRLAVKKVGDSDAYCYTPAEVEAIVALAASRPDLKWLGDVILGLVLTGLRIGELAQLRWAAIDLEKRVIRIIDNRGTTARLNDLVEVSTKSGRGRVLPIHDELQQVLVNLKRHSDGRVFHSPEGGVLRPDKIRNALIRDILAPLKTKFPGQQGFRTFVDGRLHSFRHFFCSKCASDGVPEQVVMKWLGHANSRMVRHYYHLHDEESQRQMQKLKSVGGPGAVS